MRQTAHSMATPVPRIALVAAGLEILGGQGIQAKALVEGLRQRGYAVDFVPVNPRFPAGMGWLRKLRYARTVFNELIYLPSLACLRRSDVAHVFSASYWSFLLAPVPAILAAKLFRKRAVHDLCDISAFDHAGTYSLTSPAAPSVMSMCPRHRSSSRSRPRCCGSRAP